MKTIANMGVIITEHGNSSKIKPNSSHDVRHARKFRLRTDTSLDTRCSRALNTQLPLAAESLNALSTTL